MSAKGVTRTGDVPTSCCDENDAPLKRIARSAVHFYAMNRREWFDDSPRVNWAGEGPPQFRCAIRSINPPEDEPIKLGNPRDRMALSSKATYAITWTAS